MTGNVTYLYAYDIAHEANLAAIEAKLRGTVQWFHFGRSKDAPRSFPSYRPLILQMDDVQIEGPFGPMTLSTSIKLFSVGAVSVNVRAPISCEHVADLVALRDLTVKANTTLEERIGEIVPPPAGGDQAATRYAGESDRRAGGVHDFSARCAGGHHRRCRTRLTAIARGVDRPSRERNRRDPRRRNRRREPQRPRGPRDLDAQILLLSQRRDHPGLGCGLRNRHSEACQDMFYVIEVANIQLEELKTYDMELDTVLDKAYDDVQVIVRPHAFRQRQRVLADLREIRMDLTQVTDELSNITKFIGDWHLARVYMGCVARFHLSQWQDMVSQKLRSLDSLYTMLQQDSTNRVMLMLEIAIVALFVIDLIVITVLGIK